MGFLVLGPIMVAGRDGERPVTAPRERTLLALLLLRAGRVVSTDQLVDAIWPAGPPQQARTQLQGCIHRLRRLLTEVGLPEPTILTRTSGYLIDLGPASFDLAEFRQQVAQGRRAAASGRPGEAAGEFRAALARWRGPALADVDSPEVRAAALALDDERVQAQQECLEAELAAGGGTELVAELADLVAAHPHRERLHALLMQALYRAGRSAEALAAYQRARQSLIEELGLEPGPALQALHRAILNGDPALAPTAAPAPASATPPVPRELPPEVPGFTGRAAALKILDELLPSQAGEASPVIGAIAGTAGVGKTALALRWAHRVADLFPDGQLYLNLRGYTAGHPVRPIEALSMMLRSLGLPPDQVPLGEAEAGARFRSLLAGRRVLVVLDNARSADQVRPLLPGSAGCLALVTSRDRLPGLVARDGARRLSLDVLTPDESYALLRGLLGPERVEAEPQATAELAERCGHLPLALRIAAALVDDHPTVSELVGRLAGRGRLTTLAAPGDDETAVRSAFDASYEALPKPAQRLFRLLGLVPGDTFSVAGAGALADANPAETQATLDLLHKANLVSFDGDRYAMHDLLREYAELRLQRNDHTDRATSLSRYLDWYVATAAAARRQLYGLDFAALLPANLDRPLGADPASPDDARRWLERNRANSIAVVRHAADHGYPLVAVHLAELLRLYHWNGLHRMEALAIAHASLRAARILNCPDAKASAWLNLADARSLQGDREGASRAYMMASAQARRAGWSRGEAAAESNLATTYMDAGDLRAADRHLTRALAFDHPDGSTGFVAGCKGNLGFVRCDRGELRKARALWRDALKTFSELGSTYGEATALIDLARVQHLLGHYSEAADHLDRALPLAREIGDRGGEGYGLTIRCAVDRDTGRYQEALLAAEAALALVRDILGRVTADAWNAMGETYLAMADFRQALESHERALEIAQDTPFQRVTAMIGIGEACSGLRDHEPARRSLTAALDAARAVGYRVLAGQALTALAEASIGTQRLDQARRYAQVALKIHRRTGYRLGEARSLAALATIELAAGQSLAAQPYRRGARQLFRQLGTPEPAVPTYT